MRDFDYIIVESYGSLTTKYGKRKLFLNEKVLSEILKVPMEGIGSIVWKAYCKHLMEICGKMLNLNTTNVPKKFLKGGYQLFFELVNNVLLPRSEKRIMASTIDLFLMANLRKFEPINFLGIILEHMEKILDVKDGKHWLGYGYFYFNTFSFLWKLE